MSDCEHDPDGQFAKGNNCGGDGNGRKKPEPSSQQGDSAGPPAPVKHKMPAGKVEDPSSAYSWLSPDGVFHPFPRNKPAALRLKNPVGFTSHHEWAQAHGVEGGEKELQSHGWARVVPGGKTLYAGTGEGKSLTSAQRKALKDHAIIVGTYDDVVHENVRRKAGGMSDRPLWQKDSRAFCPTGEGGGVDNSCGLNEHGDVRVEENSEGHETSLGDVATHIVKVHGEDGKIKAVMHADISEEDGVLHVVESNVPKEFQNQGVYTSLLKALSQKYRVHSDTQLSQWAEKAYKKLGAEFSHRDGRYELDNRKNKWSPRTIKAAASRWKGDPGDLGLHVQDIIDGKPAPKSGTGWKLREMANALLDEVKHNSKPAPTLYRGDSTSPDENTSPLLGWTSNKAVAEKWAKARGGEVHTLEGAKGVKLSEIVGDRLDMGEDEWVVLNHKESRSADCGRDAGGRFAGGNTCQAIAEALSDELGEHEGQTALDIPDIYGKDGKQTDIGRKLHQMNVKESELADLIKRMGGEPARTRAQIVHPGIHLTIVSPKGKSLYHIDLGYMEAKIYATGARDDDLEKIKADAASVFPKVYFRKGSDFEVHAHDDPKEFKAGKSHSRSEDVGLAARIASLQVFAESRNCGIGPGGFQAGNTCAGDDTVVVYHHTSSKNADAIKSSGVLKSAGEPHVYVTTHPTPDIGYGDTAVPIRISKKLLELDDEFPGGRKDFRISVGKPGGSVKVATVKESRNCGIGPGGFQAGNTCAHSKGADVAKGAAKGAALGAASAVVGAAPYGPYVAKGAAIGAATGAAKGLIDHSTRAGRIKDKIAEIGTTEKKVEDMVAKLGGTAKTKADVVGDALHISVVNSQGQRAFHVDMTKEKITVYPRRPSGMLSHAEIERVRDVAKQSVPKTTEIVVKSHSKSYVAVLIKSGFKVIADATGVLLAAYVVPPVADIAHGEVKYEINRARRKR